MEKIVYFLRDSFLKAGLSNEFVGFETLYHHYRQAAVALEVGSECLIPKLGILLKIPVRYSQLHPYGKPWKFFGSECLRSTQEA